MEIQIEKSDFIPQVLVGSEKRNNHELENDALSTGFFSITSGDAPEILSNYIFTNDKGQQAHLSITTQNIQEGDETIKFKVLQLHFNNSENNYSVIYVQHCRLF